MALTGGEIGARAIPVNLLKEPRSGYVPAPPEQDKAGRMIRDDIKAALITAMKARDADRTGAIRLIQSAIKNRDIELRTAAAPADDDTIVREVLQKMVKQRRESIEMFDKGDRPELAAIERAELAVIEGFLPAQMDEDAAKAAIAAIVAETGASSVKDMGRVMAALKARHAADMDMSRASGLVKAALAG
jgi:uncharacterized protein YqeY